MTLDFEFEEINQSFDPGFDSEQKSFDIGFGEVQQVTEYIGGEQYEGKYIAIPTTEEQIFKTKGKVLLDDMTVKSIPFFNVSNTSGGNTVYIASEV